MSIWSTIVVLPRPVTNTICSIPASRASSTAYWISGRAMIGSISFGIALVAGRKRVPSPATGNTAFLIGLRLAMRAVYGAGRRAVNRQTLNGLTALPLPRFRLKRCHGQDRNRGRQAPFRHHPRFRREERGAHAGAVRAADRRAVDAAQPAAVGRHRQLPAPDDPVRRVD